MSEKPQWIIWYHAINGASARIAKKAGKLSATEWKEIAGALRGLAKEIEDANRD